MGHLATCIRPGSPPAGLEAGRPLRPASAYSCRNGCSRPSAQKNFSSRLLPSSLRDTCRRRTQKRPHQRSGVRRLLARSTHRVKHWIRSSIGQYIAVIFGPAQALGADQLQQLGEGHNAGGREPSDQALAEPTVERVLWLGASTRLTIVRASAASCQSPRGRLRAILLLKFVDSANGVRSSANRVQ